MDGVSIEECGNGADFGTIGNITALTDCSTVMEQLAEVTYFPFSSYIEVYSFCGGVVDARNHLLL